MFVSLQKITFLLMVFCLSFQVGYHFWPEFAYVGGVRIDYLSPTLYLLDILIISFIIFSFPALFRSKLSFSRDIFLRVLIIIFLASVTINTFYIVSPASHIYGILKLIELTLFGFCVASFFSKKDVPMFINILCLSAITSSIIAIFQFINQRSIGGALYYIGERTFSLSTIGISTVNIGQQLLRPYAAFAHPNILGFFLLMAIVFAGQNIFVEKENKRKFFLIFSIVIAEIGLLLTFSRINILLSIIFFIWLIISRTKKEYIKYPLGAAVLLIVLVIVSIPQIFNQYFLLRGIDFREELLVQSLTMFKSSAFNGIGLNNFFIEQLPLIKNISPTNFQPPHNIFILWLLQVGLVGFFLLPYIFYLAFRSVLQKLRYANIQERSFFSSIFFLLIAIIIAGMFDHYFLTVEQGQIMLALILGLALISVSFPKSLTIRKSKSRK